jgi:hypothetical protein
VISHTLSLNLGVVQMLAFVASENSMFDSQFSLIARTRLHQLRVKNSLRFHPMAIYSVKFFNQIKLPEPNFEPTPGGVTSAGSNSASQWHARQG